MRLSRSTGTRLVRRLISQSRSRSAKFLSDAMGRLEGESDPGGSALGGNGSLFQIDRRLQRQTARGASYQERVLSG